MAPGKKQHKCGQCKLGIDNNASCILCDVCNLWVHSTCAGFSEDDMTTIRKLPSMSFICTTCKNNLATGGSRDEIANLSKKFDTLCDKFNTVIAKGTEDRDNITSKLDSAVSDIKKELNASVNSLKSDITKCNDHILKVESDIDARITLLEAENNMLHKKFNSTCIVINGLPDCLLNITETVIKLANFYNLEITYHDINQAMYINNKKSLLVKFNCLSIRNDIVNAYFKNLKARPLKAADIVPGSDFPASLLNHRIFINEHYSPAAAKLNSICVKLRKKGIISKYRIINANKPLASLTLPNNVKKELNIDGCAKLLDCAGAGVVGSSLVM